jgi:hypothetical protein
MAGIGHNKPHVSVNSLSAEDKKKVKNAIVGLNDSMTRAAAERDYQKETVNNIAQEVGLDKKVVRRMAKTFYKSNFNEEQDDNKSFEELYTVIVKET